MRRLMLLLLMVLVLASCSSDKEAESVSGTYIGNTDEGRLSLSVNGKEMDLKFQLLEPVDGITGYGFLIKDQEGTEITRFSLPQIEGSKTGMIDANLASDTEIINAPAQVDVTIKGKTIEIPVTKR